MVSSIVEEEEVAAEVEAVQAVYGDDCVVLKSYTPHLHLLLKPRTADVTSQQVSLSLLFSISVWLPRKQWKVKPKPRKDKRKTFKTESKDQTFCFTQISCGNFFPLQSHRLKKKKKNYVQIPFNIFHSTL